MTRDDPTLDLASATALRRQRPVGGAPVRSNPPSEPEIAPEPPRPQAPSRAVRRRNHVAADAERHASPRREPGKRLSAPSMCVNSP